VEQSEPDGGFSEKPIHLQHSAGQRAGRLNFR
jgi:hypothetical protein